MVSMWMRVFPPTVIKHVAMWCDQNGRSYNLIGKRPNGIAVLGEPLSSVEHAEVQAIQDRYDSQYRAEMIAEVKGWTR